MKDFLKNITVLSLAGLMLLSTMSFTINKHFCGDYLVSTSVVVKATTCGMEKQMPYSEKDCSILKKNCCKEVSQLIEGQDDLQLSFSDISFQQQVFITSFVITYLNLFEGLDTHINPFIYYSPPLVVKDIQLLDEVFLI